MLNPNRALLLGAHSIGCIETAAFVRAVAEGAIGGVSAAAEGDGWFVGGDGVLVTFGVDDLDETFNNQRTIITQVNCHVGHERFSFFGWNELGGEFIACSHFECESVYSTEMRMSSRRRC